MKKHIIRVGTVGLGGIANGVHLPGIRKSPDLTLVALCDIDAGALRAAQEEYGIDDAHCFTDYRALIACPDVDAVDICTPNDSHVAIAMAAVEAGKPYSLEKPIALKQEEAGKLAAASREKDIPNMVCFSYRFKAAARYARDMIQSGAIGRIYHVNMQYLQAWGLPDVDCPLVWRFVRSRTGTGALGDLGSHAIDLAQFVSQSSYESVVTQMDTFVKERKLPEGGGTGMVDVDDSCNFMAQMKNGASASFQISRFAFGRGNYQRMEIYGSQGAVVYTLDARPGEDEIEICAGPAYRDTNVFTKLPVPDRYKADQMQAFADIISGGGDGLTATIRDGYENQRVLDAVEQSFRERRWVAL